MDIADVGNGMGNFLDYEPPDTSNILLIGLQGAGKTSLMVAVERMDMTLAQQREAQERDVLEAGQPQPAARYFDFRVSPQLNLCFTDLSGDPSLREDWQRYAEKYDYDGVAWVVDSADRDKIAESAQELERVMNLDALRNRLLFILATKQDVDGALDTGELARRLKLNLYPKRWILPVSAKTTSGLKEAMTRISKEIGRYLRKKEAGYENISEYVPPPSDKK